MYDYAKDALLDGQLRCRVWKGGHVFTRPMRRAAYDFLEDKL